MEAGTSAQPVQNSGHDTTKSRGTSRGSRGRARRGRGGKPKGSQPENKSSGDSAQAASKLEESAAVSSSKPSKVAGNEDKSPARASTKNNTKRASGSTGAQASGESPNEPTHGKEQDQQQQVARPRTGRSRRGRGRGAGPRTSSAKRPSGPSEPTNTEDPVDVAAPTSAPCVLPETPAVAEPVVKPQATRPRLQAGVKERLQKRVREAVAGLENVKEAIVDLQKEQKQEEKLQEEVKNAQDEEVDDELIDDELAETTGDEDEREGAKENGGKDSKKKPRTKRKKATKAERAAKQEAHFQLVMEAARTVVRVLEGRGISCAVFGSLAARLYGSYRCPKDVDMLVLQDPSIPLEQQLTAEQLKVMFLDTSPVNFYLKLPRNPEDTYRILYYRREYLGLECKVDILVPGTMYLPHTLSPNHELTSARLVDRIPLVPFGLLLLHKLQGWDDHRLAEEEFRQKKQVQDATDVKKIMGMTGEVNKLVKTVGELSEERWWRHPVLFSEEFRDLTIRRVDDYSKEFPGSAKGWKALGFDVLDPAPKTSTSSNPPSVANAAPPVESQSHNETLDPALSPQKPHELDLQPPTQPNGAVQNSPQSPNRDKAKTPTMTIPPFPRVKEVLDGIVTEGTLFTPDPDDPVSPDELVCRVGGLTGAPEIVPIVGGGRLAA